MQFNTIVLSGLCALKTVPSARMLFFFNSATMTWGLHGCGCQQGLMLRVQHFGITNCGRVSSLAGQGTPSRGELRGNYAVGIIFCSSPGSRTRAQPAQPPSQAPGSQPRKRQDVSFLFCQPGQVLLIPSCHPSARGAQGQH